MSGQDLEYKTITDIGSLDTTPIDKMANAVKMAQKMIQLDLVANSEEAMLEQVKEIMAWSDAGIAAMDRVLERYAAKQP